MDYSIITCILSVLPCDLLADENSVHLFGSPWPGLW